MSVQEFSAQMGISLPKVYELVKEPGFPTIKVGARILIPVDRSSIRSNVRTGHMKNTISYAALTERSKSAASHIRSEM